MDSLELDRSKGSLLPHTVVSAKQNVYFFSPVHFREREIGYLVLENCDYLLDHQFLFETLNTFRTSIEALYGKLILRKKNKQLSQLYIHDSLTGLYNRMAYEKLALPLFQQYMQKGRPVGILFADADHLKYINDKVNQFKQEDGYLYAIYGTPAESLCGLQVEQFRKMYGIVEGVSDRPYVSNSFHCHVTEDVTPIEKQDLEGRFWELCNGGKIQYVRYPIGYNKEAIRTLIRRAMNLGYYEGVNLSLAYCDDCGHQELEMNVCPVCGSHNLTKIDRMNGYLSYSRVHGDTRLNEAKMAEIAERKSM